MVVRINKTYKILERGIVKLKVTDGCYDMRGVIMVSVKGDA